jgi:UDP-GlcNAc:undecaprenyl-phosphate GlcNAc-1-phosphate transferase
MTPARLGVLLTIAGAASLCLGLACTRLAIHLAARIGFVDRPGGHKSHARETPYGGGAAIFVAMWLPIAAALAAAWLAPQASVLELFGEEARAYAGGMRERTLLILVIFAGALILHVLGTYDDLRPQRAGVKLAVMLGVGMLTALAGVRIVEFAHPAVSVPATVIWIALITNAFNFLDNMDGLSAGVASVCTAAFIACGLLAGQVLVPALACVLLGACLGFLVFNIAPARIFMGDAGSLVVGYMLAVVSILTTYYESGGGRPPYALAIPLVILAVPLYDLASVVLIRIREGRNPLRGDQRHFSHRLVEHGLSRRFAVLTVCLAAATTGLTATLLPAADLRQTITVGVIVAAVLSIIAILESRPRRRDE